MFKGRLVPNSPTMTLKGGISGRRLSFRPDNTIGDELGTSLTEL